MKYTIASRLGPQPWSWRQRIDYYRWVIYSVFWLGDTTTIRVQLGLASFGFTLGLWLPLDTFSLQSFIGLSNCFNFKSVPLSVRAHEWVWGGLFLLHALGVSWRLVDLTPRIKWAFVINAYGLVVWITTSGLITQTIGRYTPALSLEVVVILAAFVALIRTGLNDEQLSP